MDHSRNRSSEKNFSLYRGRLPSLQTAYKWFYIHFVSRVNTRKRGWGGSEAFGIYVKTVGEKHESVASVYTNKGDLLKERVKFL